MQLGILRNHRCNDPGYAPGAARHPGLQLRAAGQARGRAAEANSGGGEVRVLEAVVFEKGSDVTFTGSPLLL